MSPVAWFKRMLRMCGHAFSITVHERLDVIEQRSAETDNALLQASIRLAERVREGRESIAVATADPKLANPSAGLAVFLYSNVPSRIAVDLGGADRELIDALRSAGYQVRKAAELGPGEAAGHGDALVLARESDLSRTVSADQVCGWIVMVSNPGDPEELVSRMRAAGFFWHLVIYRESQSDSGKYFANYAAVIPWKDASFVFFRDHGTFTDASNWCAGVLKKTYFRYIAK